MSVIYFGRPRFAMIAATLALATSLAACGPQPAPVSAFPPAVAASDVGAVPAPQAGGIDAGSAALGAAAGGLAGMAIGSAMSKNSQPQTVIVQQPAQSYGYGSPSRYYGTPKPTTVTTTTVTEKKSLFGGKKTVITRTTTRRR